MKIKNLLLNLGIIFAGPIATFYMILSGEGFKMKTSYFFVVGIGTAIALIVSLVINSAIKKDIQKAVTISVIVSEVIYFLVLIGGSINSPEDLMWLPIALIFLPIYSLPTAISVSYGTSKIIKAKQRQNDTEGALREL